MNVLKRAKRAGVKKTFAEIRYLFNVGKGELNLINTLLLILTVVGVFKLDIIATSLMVVGILASFLIVGIIWDKLGLNILSSQRKELRNKSLTESKNNTREILRILKKGERP